MKIETLKEKAREHEQEENWMEAMDLYSRALARSTEVEEEPDIALHNRIGDLQVRIGDLQGAVENYETAIDLYLEADLPNNAMAVCRKLERSAPGRPSVLLRMGQIRIRQGFVVDARQDFLNYAEVQLAQGDAEEALRALEEFAALAPEDVEIRLFLAKQLRGSDQSEDALPHLASVYRILTDRGEEERAEGIREQMEELAPDEELESLLAAGGKGEAGSSDSDEEGALGAGDGLDGFQTTSLAEIALDDPAESQADLSDSPAAAREEEETEPPPLEEAPEELSEPDDPLAGTVFDLDEGEGAAPSVRGEDDAAARDEMDPHDLDSLPTLDDDEEEPEPLPTLDDQEAELGPLPTLGEDEVDAADLDAASLPLLGDDEGDLDAPPSLDDLETEDEERDDLEPLPGLDEPALSDDEARDASSTLDQVTLDGGETLRALASQVDLEPGDADAWRRLGVRLFEEGEDERAREALETAHRLYAEADDPERAMRVVRELIFHEPDEVEHYQRLVEYANRTGDRALLVPAFLELAEALERNGAQRKAEVVYGQVLALDPRNPRARKALAVGPSGEADAGVEEARSGAFVDLGGMVLDEETPDDIFRWRLGDADPSGDEEADFAKMLSRFKEKVATGMPADDATAHYDLGAAYKDMGLVDEAIAQFQKALRARPNHLPAFEMVGQCFLEKGEPKLAVRTLSRALKVEAEVEDELLGIYYYLAKAYEEAGNPESAREFYERVFSLDINFMDVTERLRVLR